MTREIVAGQTGRCLPLRLCEVLEREFVNIHGQPGSAPTWRLESEDIEYPELLHLLQFPSQSASAAAIVAIGQKLEGMGVKIPHDGAGTKPLEPQVLSGLNAALLADDELYDHHLLDDDSEAWQVAEALARQRTERRGPSRRATQGRSGIGSSAIRCDASMAGAMSMFCATDFCSKPLFRPAR